MIAAERCHGPNRREILRFGAIGLAGMASGVVPSLLRAKEPDRTTNDPAVIFIWLPGGPPHLDTFDMKPDAPSEYRGLFRPIPTNVPGIDICEHLPKLAQQADRFSLIRSVAHTFADHGGGHKKFLTGRDPLQPDGFINDYPMAGSMASKLLSTSRPNAELPNYVAGVDGGRAHIDTFSFGSAYVGRGTHPFFVVGDPAEPKFATQNLAPTAGLKASFDDRRSLLARLDEPMPHDRTGLADALDATRSRAFGLLSSAAATSAFDLNREPAKLRERYGNHRYGQRCLMARRLVEAGVPWVTMVLENPTPPGEAMIADGAYNWDSHAVNCDIFKDTKYKLGFLDQALSALFADLAERGLDERTLVIVTGEFGRTPKLEYDRATGRPGRDHWPQAMSILAAGAVKTGQIIGSTTSKGENPKDRPLTPNHLWATVFEHLKLDYKTTNFPDGSGRPMPMLNDGEPIRELLG